MTTLRSGRRDRHPIDGRGQATFGRFGSSSAAPAVRSRDALHERAAVEVAAFTARGEDHVSLGGARGEQRDELRFAGHPFGDGA